MHAAKMKRQRAERGLATQAFLKLPSVVFEFSHAGTIGNIMYTYRLSTYTRALGRQAGGVKKPSFSLPVIDTEHKEGHDMISKRSLFHFN